MTTTTLAPALPVTAIPLREWLPWAIFAGLILLLAIYFVGAEQGATSLISGKMCTSSCTTDATCSAFPVTDRQEPTAMVRTLLVRGMLVGIVAGLLSFGFLKVYGEPQVDRAIAFESQQNEAKAAAEKAKGGHMHMSEEDEPELVSRSVQAGLGLLTAVMIYSVAFGGLFGLAFAFANGRLPGALSPQAVSVLLAATGFIAIYLVPNLKYPANPPSVGDPETIGTAHRALFRHDRDFTRGHGRSGGAEALVCCPARRLERQPGGRRVLHRDRRRRRLAAAGGQRSSRRNSRGGAVEVPHRFARRAIHHVDDAGPAVWRLDPACGE